MKLKVNGVEIPDSEDGVITLEIDMGGVRADMPEMSVEVTNGEIDVYPSRVRRSEGIHIHPFG